MNKLLYGIVDSTVASSADIDETALVYRSIVGERCWLNNGAMICFSELGDMSYLSSHSRVYSCKIGKFSSISWNVSVGPANHDYRRISSHSMLFASRFGMINSADDRYYNQYDKETVIGNDVWIGCNAVIMRGVHIGDGAVIGANSVITKDVEPYTVMGGVNVVLKKRFNEDIIKQLLNLQWWNYPIETIKDNLDMLAEYPSIESLKKIKNKLNI